MESRPGTTAAKTIQRVIILRLWSSGARPTSVEQVEAKNLKANYIDTARYNEHSAFPARSMRTDRVHVARVGLPTSQVRDKMWEGKETRWLHRSGLASEPAPPRAMQFSFKISARASEAAGNQVQWRRGWRSKHGRVRTSRTYVRHRVRSARVRTCPEETTALRARFSRRMGAWARLTCTFPSRTNCPTAILSLFVPATSG